MSFAETGRFHVSQLKPGQDDSAALEQARRDSEQIFERLLDSSNDAVVAMDAAGLTMGWNRSAEAMFGWKASEVLGRRLSDFLIPPEHRDAHEVGRRRVLSGGESKVLNRRIEMEAMRADGTRVPIELSIWPVHLETQMVFGAFVRDITARKQTQAALQRSEQRLRHVLDHVDVGILVVQGGKIVFSNPRTEALTGRTATEIRDTPFTEFIHVDDREMVMSNYAKRIRGEQLDRRYSFRIAHRAGHTVWVDLSAVVIDWDGAPATLSFVADITDRKMLEDQLTRSLSERETILQNSIVGIAFLDPAGRMRWANRALVDMFGAGDEDHVGLSLERFYADREEYLRIGAASKDAILGGRPFETELSMRRAGGQAFWAYLSGRAVNPGDLNQGTVWVIMDISARKALEEELQLSNRRHQLVVNNVGEGMTVVQDGRFVFVNPAFERLTGYRGEELIGSPFDRLVHPEDLTIILSNRQQRLAGDSYSQKFDFRVLCKDGREVWMQVSAALVDWDGKPATLSFLSDISHRKQAEADILSSLERQKELNLLKSRFVSMTSHEFRTPLAAILSSAELLRHYSDRMPASERQELLESIEKAVGRMTAMLDDVLLLGKVEAEKLEFAPHAVELSALCGAVIAEAESLRKSEKAPRLVLRWEPSLVAAPLSLLLDEKLLRRVLGNLLANAIKYSPNGGAVTLAAARAQDKLVLKVEDQGMGMPKEDLARLFESFYRASNVGNISGTGLGLAIVKHAVTVHQGDITVESELGRGTTFTVRLPFMPIEGTHQP
ncbi:MAG: PAS domain S-box protein [Betaproteobacteria bacterium]|nr:PAS domain S-box protein [Betaproteobacteria bacterium]